MKDKLDYKKACEEALNSMEEEFDNGAKAMLDYIRSEGTECLGINCNCVICESGKKFLRKRKKIKLQEVKNDKGKKRTNYKGR